MEIEEMVQRFEQAGLGIAKRSSDGSIFHIATHVERSADGKTDWEHTVNKVMFDYYKEVWHASYLVGQRGCIIKTAQIPEPVIQSVIDFYDIGEREQEKLRNIGLALLRLQASGFIAEIITSASIKVGVFDQRIYDEPFDLMLALAKAGAYHSIYQINKEISGWSLITLPETNSKLFNTADEAAQYILYQHKS